MIRRTAVVRQAYPFLLRRARGHQGPKQQAGKRFLLPVNAAVGWDAVDNRPLSVGKIAGAALSDCGSEMQLRKSQLAPGRRANRRSTANGCRPSAQALDQVAPRNAVGSGLRFNFCDGSQGGCRKRHRPAEALRCSCRCPLRLQHNTHVNQWRLEGNTKRAGKETGQRLMSASICAGSPLGERQPSVPGRRMSKGASSMPMCYKEPAAYASGATPPEQQHYENADCGTVRLYAVINNPLSQFPFRQSRQIRQGTPVRKDQVPVSCLLAAAALYPISHRVCASAHS